MASPPKGALVQKYDPNRIEGYFRTKDPSDDMIGRDREKYWKGIDARNAASKTTKRKQSRSTGRR